MTCDDPTLDGPWAERPEVKKPGPDPRSGESGQRTEPREAGERWRVRFDDLDW